MSERALLRPTGKDDSVDALARLVDAFNNLAQAGIFHGGIIRDLALTTSNLEVRHDLGRVPTIWMPLSLNANAVVYCDTSHDYPREYINLRASASVTARVLIA